MDKDEAHKPVDRMPADATWEDLMHEACVREAIERGLSDSEEGRMTDVKEVRASYGLSESRFTLAAPPSNIALPSVTSG